MVNESKFQFGTLRKLHEVLRVVSRVTGYMLAGLARMVHADGAMPIRAVELRRRQPTTTEWTASKCAADAKWKQVNSIIGSRKARLYKDTLTHGLRGRALSWPHFPVTGAATS